MHGERSTLDALFVVSFREDQIAGGSRPGDIKASVIATAVHRLHALGLKGVDIVSVGRNSVSLRISTASVFDEDDIAQVLGRPGELAFQFVSPDNAAWGAEAQRDPDGFRVPDGYERREMAVKRAGQLNREVVFVRSSSEALTGAEVHQAVVTDNGPGGWTISLDFSPAGAKTFHRITAENVGKRLAIVVDGDVYSAPMIKDAIRGGKAQISASIELKEAKLLAAALDSGRDPVPVEVEVSE